MNTRSNDDNEARLQWLVLVNDEGQHSLWPMSRPVPEGWNEVGPEGDKEDCLAYVAEHWTDMRPVSVRG